jgi:hypothetical protein
LRQRRPTFSRSVVCIRHVGASRKGLDPLGFFLAKDRDYPVILIFDLDSIANIHFNLMAVANITFDLVQTRYLLINHHISEPMSFVF